MQRRAFITRRRGALADRRGFGAGDDKVSE